MSIYAVVFFFRFFLYVVNRSLLKYIEREVDLWARLAMESR